MYKSIIFIMSFYSVVCWGYFPTLDSLLRNGSNVDIGKDTVVANLMVREINPELNTPMIKESGVVNKYAMKILIVNERESNPLITHLKYKGGVISRSTLVSFENKNLKLIPRFFPSGENIDGELFYALLGMLLNNESRLLIHQLKRLNAKVKYNTELVNAQKLSLLNSYKKYLMQLKDQNEEDSDLENPLYPEGEAAKKRVKEVREANFLKRDPLVSRIKVENDFYWEVVGENIYMKFNTNHQIKDIRLETTLGTMELTFGKFVNFGSQMKFPEFIWFTTTSGRKYEIKAERVSKFKDSLAAHSSRLKRYEGYVKENNIVDDEVKLPFLLL